MEHQQLLLEVEVEAVGIVQELQVQLLMQVVLGEVVQVLLDRNHHQQMLLLELQIQVVEVVVHMDHQMQMVEQEDLV